MRRRGWLALLAVLLLGGCSVLSIVYDNADRLALAYADDLFDLDHSQGKRFRERVRVRMALHRDDELPRYTAFLREVRGAVGGAPSSQDVDGLLVASRALIELGIRRSLPLMADTLVELTPQQVAHLAEEIADANEDYAEELAEDTPAERQREREQDLIKEMERWTGRLAEPQRARLRELAAAVPDGSRAWFEHRQLRQRGLLALLRAHATRDAYFAYVEEWWLGDRHLDPVVLQQLERSRRLTGAALAELVATLTSKQRARVVARLDDLIEDLDDLHAAGGGQRGA